MCGGSSSRAAFPGLGGLLRLRTDRRVQEAALQQDPKNMVGLVSCIPLHEVSGALQLHPPRGQVNLRGGRPVYLEVSGGYEVANQDASHSEG